MYFYGRLRPRCKPGRRVGPDPVANPAVFLTTSIYFLLQIKRPCVLKPIFHVGTSWSEIAEDGVV